MVIRRWWALSTERGEDLSHGNVVQSGKPVRQPGRGPYELFKIGASRVEDEITGMVFGVGLTKCSAKNECR